MGDQNRHNTHTHTFKPQSGGAYSKSTEIAGAAPLSGCQTVLSIQDRSMTS